MAASLMDIIVTLIFAFRILVPPLSLYSVSEKIERFRYGRNDICDNDLYLNPAAYQRDHFSSTGSVGLASSPTRIVCFKIFLRLTRYEQRDTNFWRTQLRPIRTTGQITVSIKILPVHQPYLYQKLPKKATQLRLLGMSCENIAISPNINRKTAIKACKYEGSYTNALAIKR